MSRGDAHLMIGPGGVAKHPRSESAELDRAIANLELALPNMVARDAEGIRYSRSLVEKALASLASLRVQVAQGYHRNPGGVYTPFKIVGVIGRDVHSIAYTHAKDGKPYRHDFERGNSEVLAVERHGKRELLVTSPKGVPLWDEF